MKAVNKFLFVLCTLLIFGEGNVWANTAQQKEKDLKKSRTWYGNHATFTLSGDNGNNNALNAINVNANRQVTISWNVNSGSTINVTKLKLWIGHNGMVNPFKWVDCDLYINSSKAGSFGTIINEEREYSGYSLGNNDSFVFYPSRDINLYGVEITYTITPNAPTVSPSTKSVDVTLDASSPTTIDYASCFSTSETHYTELIKYAFASNPNSKGVMSGNNFYATAAGTYTIYAYIDAKKDCHVQSANSSNLTITVNRRNSVTSFSNKTIGVTVNGGEKVYATFPEKDDNRTITYTITKGEGEWANKDDDAHIESGNKFYATAAGVYTIHAAAAANTRYKAISSDFTVTVNRVDQALSWDNESDINENLNIKAGTTYGIKATATSGLNVTYETSNSSYLAVNNGTTATTANGCTLSAVEKFDGTITLTASQPGNKQYEAATSIIKEFRVWNKYTPALYPSDTWATAAITTTCKVGAQYTVRVDKVSPGLGSDDTSDFYFTVSPAGSIHAERVGNIITITAWEEANATITFIQQENESIFGNSWSYNFAISKHEPTIAVPSNQTLLVDGSYTASALDYTNVPKNIPDSGATNHDFYYTINHELSTSYNRSDVVITFNPTTKQIVAQNAGTATITIVQKSTREYSYKTASFTITVNKYDNEILNTYSWAKVDQANWTQKMGFETGAYVSFYSKNSEVGAPHIQVLPKTGRTIATFWPDSVGDPKGDAIWALWNVGEATWEVSQPENYKYKAAHAKTLKVLVDIDDNPDHCQCNLLEKVWSVDNEKVNTASAIDSLGFGGVGDSISFWIKSRGTSFGNQLEYRFFTDGAWGGWTQETAKSTSDYNKVPTDSAFIALGQGEHNTTAVQFKESGIVIKTDNPYVNSIRVKRKRWFKIQDKAGKSAKEITSLPEMKRFVDDDTVKVTFYVNFSTCDSILKVASNDDHVTFRNNLVKDTASYITAPVTTNGFSEITAVTVYYYSDEVEEKTVTITIYTQFENKFITIPVKTEGYIFKGTNDDQWTEAKNWNVGRVPNAKHDVTIEAAAVVSAEQAVRSMDITTGSVTIAPQGGLTIGAGGVKGASAEKLILKAGTEGKTKGQTGYLRISPEYKGTMPQATVELFSIGYYNMKSTEENVAAWQYVGVPVQTSDLARTFFKSSWVYTWDEEHGNWINQWNSLVMLPFVGYATTQYKKPEGALITFTGSITPDQVREAPVYANGETVEQGCNVLANSFTAPIDITKFSTSDFSEGVNPTIYIFNTGSRKDVEKKSVEEVEDATRIPGQYVHIPVYNVEPLKSVYDGLPTTIAPMQGFCIKTTKNGTVTMDYNRLVWNGDYTENKNRPLHAPKKTVETSTLGSLCIALSANGWNDNLYMLESVSYDKAYEAGYDAPKMESGEFNIFAIEGDQQLAVDATNNMVGTHIGVRAGEETTYSMSFSHMKSEHELLFFDSETNEVIDIYDGLEYTFNVEPNTTITERFIILEREKTPEVTTAIENAAANSVKVKKFIKDNQLYILKNGVLYNATGARVH